MFDNINDVIELRAESVKEVHDQDSVGDWRNWHLRANKRVSLTSCSNLGRRGHRSEAKEFYFQARLHEPPCCCGKYYQSWSIAPMRYTLFWAPIWAGIQKWFLKSTFSLYHMYETTDRVSSACWCCCAIHMTKYRETLAMGFKELTPYVVIHLVHIKGDRDVSLNLCKTQRSISDRRRNCCSHRQRSKKEMKKKRESKKQR